MRSVPRVRDTVTQMLDVLETLCVEERTADNITETLHLQTTAALKNLEMTMKELESLGVNRPGKTCKCASNACGHFWQIMWTFLGQNEA